MFVVVVVVVVCACVCVNPVFGGEISAFMLLFRLKEQNQSIESFHLPILPFLLGVLWMKTMDLRFSEAWHNH